MLLNPQKIIVEKEVLGLPLTKRILSRFNGIEVEEVDRAKTRRADNSDCLVIAKQRGKFVKKCPGTPSYSCCDYYVLNLGIGCDFNCTYCFLHQYMNTPSIVYANTNDLIDEVNSFCAAHNSKLIRLGSGEFIDSVGFDELTSLNETLIPELCKIKNLQFEVKTKSGKVDHLLGLKHNGRAVISWSVNPEKVVKEAEEFADSLQDRIESAELCQNAGYKIGFHFDPLIHYSGWEKDYQEVVDLIFSKIEPRSISWISLGALRFNPSLKPIIKQKFPESRIIYEEMITGLDGKLRYFISIRLKMFKTLMNYIRANSCEVPVYLCMESKELAKEVGAIPGFRLQGFRARPFKGSGPDNGLAL